MCCVTPSWVTIRPGVATLVPFPNKEKRFPSVPRGILLARIVWNYNPNDKLSEIENVRSQLWICDTARYGLMDIHPRARNQIRKTQREGTQVVQLQWREAWDLMAASIDDTLHRNGRLDRKSFLNRLRSLRALDEKEWGESMEIWAARRNNRTGGFLLCLRYGNTYHILHGFSRNRDLKWCPNNLLVYKVTERALNELGCTEVNFGVEGLNREMQGGLSYFKRRMGFKLVPCVEQYLCHGLIKVGIKASGSCCQVMDCLLPKSLNRSFLRAIKELSNRI